MIKIFKSIFFLMLLKISLFANTLLNYNISAVDALPQSHKSALILKNYLSKTLLYDVNNIKSISIILGIMKDKPLKNISKPIHSFTNDGFMVTYKHKNLYIIGTNIRSLRYGIYAFLEKLGYGFFSANYEVIPKKTIINVNKMHIISQARFKYREIFMYEANNNNKFAIKMRLNGHFGNLSLEKKSPFFIPVFNQFPPFTLVPKMYKKLFPKYFCDGGLDYSLKGVKKLASLSMLYYIKKLHIYPGSQIYLSHIDKNSFCNSASSREIYKKYDSPSATFLGYANTIAINIAKKYPDIKVFMEAYLWSRKAPKHFPSLAKNLEIFFSDIEANFAEPLKSKENLPLYKDLTSWLKYKRDIYIWHYITNFNGYLQPFPDFYATAKDLKEFEKLKYVKGIMLESAYNTPKSDLSDMKLWIYSKLLWNPNLNINALIKEFCDAYYGPASSNIQLYLKLLNNSVIKTHSKLSVKTPINEAYLNDIFLYKAKELLENGLKKVKNNPIYKEHVQSVLASIYYILLMQGKINQVDRIKFKQFLIDSKLKYFSEGGKVQELFNMLKINSKTASLPVGIHINGHKFIDFQEGSLILCCAKIVKDNSASNGMAVRMNGNRADWGIQLPLDMLPPGRWTIYASIKIKLAENDSFVDKIVPAIFYGIYGAHIKNGKLIASLANEQYHEIKIGTVTVNKNDKAVVWIRPPNNRYVKYIYVDRIFCIKD